MKRFITILLAIFELIFYTFFMVLVDDITTENNLLELVIHFGSLILVAVIFYIIVRFILKKLNYRDKKTIYMVSVWNLVIGVIFPVILIIAIPNELFEIFCFMLLVSTFYYGILINLIIIALNYKLTNRKKQ